MKVTVEDIDAVLPQTQCGLCGFGGCMPYATSLIYENAAINLCPPGGVTVLKKLGDLLQKDAAPFIAEMQQKQKPKMLAVIREAECIGCTKCIQACPADAILGAAKLMHTVIADECSGCELCVAPCPVDCIDMIVNENAEDKSAQYRARFNARAVRLRQEKLKEKQFEKSLSQRKAYLDAAVARSLAKKVKI